MIIRDLSQQGIISPPKFLNDNTHLLVRMGSEAYGAALTGGGSDIDVVGFAIPRKEDVFPHLAGSIAGFGTLPQPFQQWTQHHVKSADGSKEYDFTVYSIVKFFQLAMTSSPNQIDALFVPQRCVIHCTHVGKLARDGRRLFLHKGAMQKLRGYAFSQMAKIKNKQGSGNDKRQATIDAHGFDTKHGYHVARLCLQAEQILTEHDLDLERNSQILQAIRRGDWTLEHLENWFAAKEIALETLYATSTLQHSPDEEAIKALLLKCLEEHYGRLDNVIQKPTDNARLLREMQAVIDAHS